MWKFFVRLSYVGTDFCGWQKQKSQGKLNSRGILEFNLKESIQLVFESALERMTGETTTCVSSGRTDAGVHAIGQILHFVLKKKEWDSNILVRGLNGILPSSIRVLEVRSIEMAFHAQRSAERKQYSYYFQQGPCPLPHLDKFSWWIRKKLDIKKMSEAVEYLKGEHDFKAFQASGANPGPTIREIFEVEVSIQNIEFPSKGIVLGNSDCPIYLIRVRLMGSGFLKQMVRGIAGTLLQIGENRRPTEDMKKILLSMDRSLVGPTAPSRGLWLEKVYYPNGFS